MGTHRNSKRIVALHWQNTYNDYPLDYLILKLTFIRGFAPKTLLTFLS
jgi:hypothetical protein